MAAPEQEFERPKGAPMWIVTFTDMISLLLTFFIMILTFSSMEEEKLNQVQGSLAGAFGVAGGKGSPEHTEIQSSSQIKFRKRERDGVTNPSIRKSQINDAINKRVQDRTKFKIPIESKDLDKGVLISLTTSGLDELYVLGSDKLNRRTKMHLREIAKMFRDLSVRISVETHIDSRTPEVKGEDPRTLTLGMALSAASVLIDEGMTPERVCATPMGDYFPLNNNETPIDRFKNRRIDLRILPAWKDEIFEEKRDR